MSSPPRTEAMNRALHRLKRNHYGEYRSLLDEELEARGLSTERANRTMELECLSFPGGPAAHRRVGEPLCAACVAHRESSAEAKRSAQRDRYHRLHPEAATRQVAQCGTNSGYNRHRRIGEPSCVACRAAHAQAVRQSRSYKRKLRGRGRAA